MAAGRTVELFGHYLIPLGLLMLAPNAVLSPFGFAPATEVWVRVVGVVVAAGLSQPMLAAFGAVDLLGALWTWTALRREART